MTLETRTIKAVAFPYWQVSPGTEQKTQRVVGRKGDVVDLLPEDVERGDRQRSLEAPSA